MLQERRVCREHGATGRAALGRLLSLWWSLRGSPWGHRSPPGGSSLHQPLASLIPPWGPTAQWGKGQWAFLGKDRMWVSGALSIVRLRGLLLPPSQGHVGAGHSSGAPRAPVPALRRDDLPSLLRRTETVVAFSPLTPSAGNLWAHVLQVGLPAQQQHPGRVGHADFQPFPARPVNQKLRGGAQHPLNQPCRGFWCMRKSENHCSRPFKISSPSF